MKAPLNQIITHTKYSGHGSTDIKTILNNRSQSQHHLRYQVTLTKKIKGKKRAQPEPPPTGKKKEHNQNRHQQHSKGDA
jgi:hypothetical protein